MQSVNRDTLATPEVSDTLSLARHASALALQREIDRPLDSIPLPLRIRAYKSVLTRNVLGNSAWGRSMRAKQIIAARWKKAKAKQISE